MKNDNESVIMTKLGPNLIQLHSMSDEDSWPAWLRITLEIAFVIFVGVSFLTFLYVTP